MRILHVITQKPFSTGSGSYLSGLMKQLGERHEQHLVCGLSSGDPLPLVPTKKSLRIDPVFFSSEELPFPVPGMSDVMPYESSLYASLSQEETDALLRAFRTRIRQAIEVFQPDAILLQHLYLLTADTAAWCRAGGITIPLMGFCHGSELRQFRHTDRWREPIAKGIRALDRIVATHPEQAQEIVAIYRLPRQNILVLGSGYDADIFYPSSEGKEENGPLQVVFTGKIARAKGVFELIQAVSRLSREMPLKLTLIGSGANEMEMAAIRQAAAQSGCPIEFAGQLPQEKIAALYRRSDLFVLPSYYEGMPLVVPEALACGLLVAVTNLPGFAAWLEPFGESATLIPRPAMLSPDRPTEQGREAFIGHIADALRHLALIKGQAELPDMSGFSWAGLSRRVEAALKELTNE